MVKIKYQKREELDCKLHRKHLRRRRFFDGHRQLRQKNKKKKKLIVVKHVKKKGKKKKKKQEIRRTLFKSKIWKKKRHSIDLYLFLNLED